MAENSETLSLFDMIEHPYATCICKRFYAFGNIESCRKSIHFCSVSVLSKLVGAREAFNPALINIVAEFFGMLIKENSVNRIFTAEVYDMNVIDMVRGKVGKMNFFTGNNVEFNRNVLIRVNCFK